MRPQQVLTTVMRNIVVDKRTDNAKPHSICFFFFLPQDQHQRKCFFQSVTKGVTNLRKQRCLDSYRQRQISQSHCDISSNCGLKQIFHSTGFIRACLVLCF